SLFPSFETVARKGARPPQDDDRVCCEANVLRCRKKIDIIFLKTGNVCVTHLNAEIRYYVGERWQEQRDSRVWSSVTSRATRKSPKLSCAKASTPCWAGTSNPARRSCATTSRPPSASRSSARRPGRPPRA